MRLNTFSQKNRDNLPETLEKGLDRTEDFVSDFKKFAVKGNVIDLAVGIVIGAAFTTIVNSLVNDIITPLIELFAGNIELEDKFIILSGGEFETIEAAQEAGANVLRYGAFIDSIINFLIVALVLFIAVKYIIGEKKKVEKKEKQKMKACKYCLEQIREEASRCKFCTAKL